MLCVFIILALTMLVTGFEVVVDKDETVLMNRAVSLKCEAEDLDDDLVECRWRAPDGTTFSSEVRGGRNFRVDMDEDGDCEITIAKAKLDQSGPWICSLEEDRGDTLEKYVFLSVASKEEDLRKNQNTEVFRGGNGESTVLICPVDVKRSTSGRSPLCVWTSPEGRRYKSSGR